MIVSIGEILADMFLESASGNMTMKLGGAPFNMAVSAARSGANVAFVGNVGDDPLGKWLIGQAELFSLDELLVSLDKERNTTIALVSLNNGERDFAFLRKHCADYHIPYEPALLDRLKPDVLHVGSLMLSEKEGLTLAINLVEYARKNDIPVSFDVNFRSDIFADLDTALEAYSLLIKSADIIKFSEDEKELFEANLHGFKVDELKEKLVCVTLGARGSYARYGDIYAYAPTKAIKPVDTTGAGDAFYGAFLAGVERIGLDNLTESALVDILTDANKKGAEATQFIGALKL